MKKSKSKTPEERFQYVFETIKKGLKSDPKLREVMKRLSDK